MRIPTVPAGGLLAMCAVVFIIWVDVALRWLDSPFIARGLLDVSAHAATGLLVVLVLRRQGSRWLLLGVFLGAVVIDIDHLPAQLGWTFLGNGEVRPGTHSLLVAMVAFGIGLLGRRGMRSAFLGAGFGIVSHLLRDMATGGVMLLWPASASIVEFPYAAYVVLLAILSCSSIWIEKSRAVSGHNLNSS